MKRRHWIGVTCSALLGTVSGCIDAIQNDGANGGSDEGGGRNDDSDEERNDGDEERDEETDLTDDEGTDESGDGTNDDTRNRTTEEAPEFVRNPEGEAEITIKIEHVRGFDGPDEYEVTVELSHVDLHQAGNEGGVRYDVEETLELQKEPGEYPDFERTLVDQREIPVATYDYYRFYGSVTAHSMAEDVAVFLSDKEYIERAVGTVFEVDDHKEHSLQLAVNEADDGYEVTDVGMVTLTW